MSRIHFEVQGKEVYTGSMRVRVSDINYGGHVGNDSILTLCHEARVRFFESMGYSEINLFGRGIIMSDAMVMYRSEGRLGDTISIRIFIDDVEKFSFDMYYVLSVPEKDHEGTLDSKSGKPLPQTEQEDGNNATADTAGSANSEKSASREIARVKTGIVFFDYEKRRIARCPKEFLAKYSV